MPDKPIRYEDMDPLKILDQPEIRRVLFHPVRLPDSGKQDPRNLFLDVAPGIRIGCRCYTADKSFPNILFFHGNGEIAADYDEIASFYHEKKLNLLVTDYRGYGYSEGTPTIASLLQDACVLFTGIKKWFQENNYHGPVWVMGRSLGSLCALEIAAKHQEAFKGLIVESGSATNLRYYLSLHGIIPSDHPVWREGKNFFNKEKIRSVTIPTLIMHAEYDSLIPLSEAEMLYRESGAKNKKLVVIPGADHNDIMFADLRLYFDSLADFIASL